ncbi:LysR family transcriptional regulator [Janthinobacterium agaricidamnosum]|uniref:LysR family transcriptional regulator n=1 Tax=Janthinobacterium agaricidamnosum TaxID=55508 RepID=A0A3G2E561_9BURK|nr:LysR family transcriptional regulator [Janthinobacterium agaricidamnosum]AYM75124.1 LysR family transcriptional regulator [Janthinobacterium agaricidamnosum]
MREPGQPSLDQLRVFVAVIDAGGFAHAARQLHRTQSVISYTIANLEEQLNVVLLDRGKRKPTLTDAGKALLADARAVALKVDGMRARAKALAGGLEAEVSVVVDVMFPTCVLVRVLEAFQAQFPTVALRLRIEAMGAVAQLVMDGSCHIGLGGWMTATASVFERLAVGHVRLIPVAAPSHALAQLAGPIPSGVAREHVQLVLSDRSVLTEGQDFGVLGLRNWRLGDLGSKHALLRAGLGWGNMPEAMVREDLTEGRLVHLPLAVDNGENYPIYLIQRADTPPGQAGKWLTERFAEQLPLLVQGF